MGFLGDFGKFFSGSNLIPNIVTGGTYGIVKSSLTLGSQVAVPAVKSLIGPLIGGAKPAGQMVSPGVTQIHDVGGPTPSYNVSYGAPTYGGGGAYDAYNYQPAFNPYGGQQSWASSIPSPQFSTPQYQTYSAPAQDRSWEDLVVAALPLFL